MKTLKKLPVVIATIFAACLMLLTAVNVQAQDSQNQDQAQAQQDQNSQDQDQGQDPDQAQNQDPPNRVAQLSYTTGSVSFQPGGTGDWVDAVLNRPLTTGDNLWADQNSRAELHIGSTAIRIDSQTSLTFLNLGDQAAQLRLSAGSMILRVRHLDDGETLEVDTPNLAFDVQSAGEYRLDVNPDGTETDISTWQGQGEATGNNESYTVTAGQQARFSGTDQLTRETAPLPASDDFDNWASQRDASEDHSESASYTSTEMTGYQDLDAYGHWHDVSGYGPVWTPAGVAADWAPYRFGHWVWVAPWGWTWVEDEPWGFAPFHYGRWAFVQSSWCWVPGPVVLRPVYSPAFVAFVGGNGFSLSVGVGGGPGVGWFPLAPGEVYVPYYHTSRAYVNNINITNTRVNVTQVTNVYNVYNNHTTNVTRITYANQRDPRAVTVVSRDTFVNARPVYKNVVRVDNNRIVNAPVTHSVGIQPARSSVIGAGRTVQFHPPAQVLNRRVVATRVPAAPQRPSFEQRSPQMNVRQVHPRNPAPSAGQRPAQPEVHNQNPPNQPNGASRQPEGGRNFPHPPENGNMRQPERPANNPPQEQNRRPEDQNQRQPQEQNQPRPQEQNQPRPQEQNRPPQVQHQGQPQEQNQGTPYEGNRPGSRNEKPNFPETQQRPPAQERAPQQQQNEERRPGNMQNQGQQNHPQPQNRPQSSPPPRPESRPESRPAPSHDSTPPSSHHEERHDQK